MTKREWELTKENLELQKALAIAQSQICQFNHDQAVAKLAALGEYKEEACQSPHAH